jgi:hypothetical protein
MFTIITYQRPLFTEPFLSNGSTYIHTNSPGLCQVYISSPSNREVQLYPQSLGSLFVTSYVSQRYGWGIRTLLHEGTHNCLLSCLPDWLTEKMLLVLESTVILGSESQETHDYILLSDSSGRLSGSLTTNCCVPILQMWPLHGPNRKHRFPQFIFACINVTTLTWHLLCRNLATDVSSSYTIPAFSRHATILVFTIT